jgi:hypothetical protein
MSSLACILRIVHLTRPFKILLKIHLFISEVKQTGTLFTSFLINSTQQWYSRIAEIYKLLESRSWEQVQELVRGGMLALPSFFSSY